MNAPQLDWQRTETDELQVTLSGSWNQGVELPASTPVLAQLTTDTGVRRLVLRTTALDTWDSRLPTYLLQLIHASRAAAIAVDYQHLPQGLQGLLHLVEAVPERSGARRTPRKSSWRETLGRQVLASVNDLGQLVRFVGENTLAIQALLTGQARFRRIDLMIALEAAGPKALPIVTLISLLVGLILAFVGAVQLSLFGAQIYIADLVGLGMSREMGALMTAVIMAGRTGAAYAAQLGTMNVNSEIDALRTLGIAPVEFLVIPRMLALVVMMPLLGIYAVFVGILGGWLVSAAIFDISLVQFFNGVVRAVDLYDYHWPVQMPELCRADCAGRLYAGDAVWSECRSRGQCHHPRRGR